MRSRRRITRCITVAALLAGQAAAADWSTLLPERTQQPQLWVLAQLPDGRAVVRGTYQFRSQTPGVVLDAALQPIGAFHDDNLNQQWQASNAVDEGVLLVHTASPQINVQACKLERRDDALNLRWSEQLPNGERCTSVAADLAGDIWVLSSRNQIYRYGSDGSRRQAFATQAIGLRSAVALRRSMDGSAVVALGANDEYGGADTLVEFAASGVVRWTWTEARTDVSYRSMPSLPGSQLLLRGDRSAGDTVLTAITSSGQQRWSRELSVHGLAALKTGEIVVATRIGAMTELRSIAADGSDRWTRQPTPCADPTYVDEPVLRANPGGVLYAHNCTSSGSSEPPTQQINRITAEGTVLWQQVRSVPRQQLRQLQLLPSGDVLGLDLQGLLQRLAAADGASSVVTLRSPLFDDPDALGLALDQSGRSTVALDAKDAFELVHFDAAGQPQWSQRWPDLRPLALTAGQGRSCALLQHELREIGVQLPGQLELRCFEAVSGMQLWSTPLVTTRTPVLVTHGQRSDGVFFSVLRNTDLQLWLHDNDGALLRSVNLVPEQEARRVRVASNGEIVVVGNRFDAPLYLARFDGNGVQAFKKPFAGIFDAITDAVALQGGQTLLRASLGTARWLVLLAADGSELWRSEQASLPLGASMDVLEQAGLLFLLGSTENGVAGVPQSFGPSAALLAVNRNDGTVVWNQAVESAPNPFTRVFKLAPDGRIVHGFTSRGNFQARSYAPDGSLRGVQLRPAAAASAGYAVLNDAGMLRVLNVVEQPALTSRLRLDSADGLLRVPPTASPLAVRGRNGAWYDPNSSGQGWLLDIDPATRSVYAAWFTFDLGSTLPLNAPARLRWFSLQGRYAENAEAVDLDILENSGGRFSAPPMTSAQVVGRARLRFQGCAAGVLDFEWTHGNLTGVSGRSVLQPLLIADPRCGNSSRTAAGFNSASSGGWFDPQTSGQGLLATVLPPEGNAPGTLFAGWFHYDPDGSADDPRQQSWLTLQGALPADGNGRAELAIYRTLGTTLSGPSTGNTQRVGSARVQFNRCDRLTMDFQFDDNEAALAYRGLHGTQQLQRLQDCPAP